MDNYEILGVAYHADSRTIKRAYAALIKEFRPDSHPQEFARIRLAYETLLEQCRYREQYEDDDHDTTDCVEEPFEQSVAEPVILPSSTDWQSENNDDSFNRLVDKPVIQPLETVSNIIEESGDRFSRLVDKPFIEPATQQTTETNSEQDDLAWLAKPAIDVSALIEQFSNNQPANEQAALACFQEHQRSFSTMNLDQRMEYEEKLYSRLIYNDRPALLVFAAASEYFDWANNLLWIKSAQSKWNKQRFDALTQLSSLYRRVCQRYNPYFQAQHDTIIKPCRLTTHYHLGLAQEQREAWFVTCQSANLTDLYHYFSETVQRRPVYVADILFGLVLAYFSAVTSYGNLTEQAQLSWFWLMPLLVLLLSSVSVLLLLAWRQLDWTMSTSTKWSVGFVLVVLSIQMPKGVGVGLFAAFFIGLGLAFLYWWLEKLETLMATITERVRQLWTAQKKTLTPQAIPPNYQNLFPHTMNKQIYPLLIAQFLSAFADNAILFTVIAMVMQAGDNAHPSWYIPALQSAFLLAYVLLGPWVGGVADHHAKSRVLLMANIIKAVGAGLLLLGVEPLLAYGIVGAGAAIYSPAKYGILPELVGHEQLVKANSWIESSTILAILLGMKIGAMLADYSTSMALLATAALFIISALATLSLPVNISKKTDDEEPLLAFGKQMALFFTTPRSSFAVLGGSIFWGAAASLRVILIAWAPLVLLSENASQIADLTLYLTVGIIVGAILVPFLIPLEHLRRARIPAYLMAVLMSGLSLTTDVLSAQAVLLVIGVMGGLFVVPINAVLQEQGQQTIGSGSAVALQNFFQNLAMLLGVGAYTLAAAQQVNPTMAMFALGVLVFSATFLVSLRLPSNNR